MTAHCPSCGYNLVPEKVVELGAMRFDPRGDACFHGEKLRLSPSEHILLGTLLASAGKFVSVDVLMNRLGSEGENKVVDVYITRLRKKLRAIDPGARHIEANYGCSRRWVDEGVAAAPPLSGPSGRAAARLARFATSITNARGGN
jgi:DNA-binding response OmpR family regulator